METSGELNPTPQGSLLATALTVSNSYLIEQALASLVEQQQLPEGLQPKVQIDRTRDGNLSSALRLFVLGQLRKRAKSGS